MTSNERLRFGTRGYASGQNLRHSRILQRRLITLATKSTGNHVFDAPARMVLRFESFLRDGARHHAPCCGKGQQIVVSAIFKAFSKNAGIGDRSGDLGVQSREILCSIALKGDTV